jgi:hypothetical protein
MSNRFSSKLPKAFEPRLCLSIHKKSSQVQFVLKKFVPETHSAMPPRPT